MKEKSIRKKLVLNKTTIAQLDNGKSVIKIGRAGLPLINGGGITLTRTLIDAVSCYDPHCRSYGELCCCE